MLGKEPVEVRCDWVNFTTHKRGRIKITAFQHGVTVADMLRDLLAREFPKTEGDPS